MARAEVTLVVMSRVPRPGRTKTRLIPALGAEGACAFHRAALGDLLERLESVAVSRRVVAWAGPRDAAADVEVPAAFEEMDQPDGDLGRRMGEMFRAMPGPVVFLGADAPDLPRRAVRDAAGQLAHRDAVFQPALDGGYTLAGFRVDPAPLLRDVPWGTDRVLETTLDRGETCGHSIGLLDPWYDVDDAASLRILRLRAPRDLPRTSEVLGHFPDRSLR